MKYISFQSCTIISSFF